MKKDLILIHGALGAAKQFDEISKILAPDFNIHIYEFPGHGNRVGEKVEFTIENFAGDLKKYLQQFNCPVNVFGFSMGGYVSLFLAKANPELFERIITLGTKFHWSVEESIKETSKLNVEVLELKVPQYCEYLKSLHGEGWKNVVEETKKMMLLLGKNPLVNGDFCSTIQTKTILMLGELDKMVTKDETELINHALLNSEFKILEGIVHPLEKIDANFLINKLSIFAS